MKLNLEVVDIPQPKTVKNKPTRARRYNQTLKGKATKQRSRAVRETQRQGTYLARPFIAWDGEGVTNADGSHSYILLANSLGDCTLDRKGISTEAAFDALLARADYDGIHILFGGNYDINMMLRDLDETHLRAIYTLPSIRWGCYSLAWRQGKSLRIQKGKQSIVVYDVLPFFQTSFVKACDQYLGTEWDSREQIIADKERRGTFDWSELAEIQKYNAAELRNLVSLANELRLRLHRVGIRITRWDGPGAIATAIFRHYEVKDCLGGVPDVIAEKTRLAYAGGRFEIILKGHTESGAYQYDINSAYPAAFRNLPCLAHGKWSHVTNPKTVSAYGVYHIVTPFTARTKSRYVPQPLWKRNKDASIYFAEYVDNWFWSPEALMVQELHDYPIVEGYEYRTDCECSPFGFVEALYLKRAALKKSGDGAHVGLKLGLNSLYGKTAQQVGWSPGPPLRIPPYHCLEWAGYVTSHCRAAIYQAAFQSPSNIIAFETDALFSRKPLDLPIGSGLGEWEMTEYASLTYLKSGLYFGTLRDGTEVVRARGFDRGSLSRSAVIEALHADETASGAIVEATETRFITLGAGLVQGLDKWQRWITKPKIVNVPLNGKRIDSFTTKKTVDGWCKTIGGVKHSDPVSVPYAVEWINPNPDFVHPDTGQTIAELRAEREAQAEQWEDEINA